LKAINKGLYTWPEGFTIDPRLDRILDRRRTGLDNNEAVIDWGHAEALAFGSILADGVPVRLSGQDSQRGTFVHRHSTLHDANTGKTYTPLQGLEQAKASFGVYNSP